MVEDDRRRAAPREIPSRGASAPSSSGRPEPPPFEPADDRGMAMPTQPKVVAIPDHLCMVCGKGASFGFNTHHNEMVWTCGKHRDAGYKVLATPRV